MGCLYVHQLRCRRWQVRFERKSPACFFILIVKLSTVLPVLHLIQFVCFNYETCIIIILYILQYYLLVIVV